MPSVTPAQTNSQLPALARERHATALQRYVMQVLGGDAARTTEVMEATLAALAAQPAGEVGEEDLLVWLLAAARRRALAVLRREGLMKRFETGDAGLAAGSSADNEEAHVTMQRLFGSLTPKQQEALRLKFQHDLSFAEIAEIIELSASSVGQLVHHAVVRLDHDYRAARPTEGSAATLEHAADDPRLTAYALGEMEPEERRAFENSRLDLKAAGARVTELRAAGQQIAQILAIETGAAAPPPRRRRRRFVPFGGLRTRRFWLSLGAVALLAAVAAGGWWFWLRPDPTEPVPSGDFRLTPADWKNPRTVDNNSASRPVFGGETPLSGSLPNRGTASPRQPRPPSGSAPAAVMLKSAAPVHETEWGGAPASGPKESPHAAPPARSAGIETGAVVGAPPALARGQAGAIGSIPPAAVPEAEAGPVTRPGQTPAEPAAEPELSTPKPEASVKPTPPPDAKEGRPSGAPAWPGAVNDPAQKFQTPEKSRPAELPLDVSAGGVVALKHVLARGGWPASAAVPVGQLVNYFTPPPAAAQQPGLFSASLESTEAPWAPTHRLVRVTLQAREAPPPARPPATLVFLIDVSGSMAPANRLPLVQEALRRVLARLRPDDRVGLVSYAGDSRLMLPPTPVAQGRLILDLLARLQAGGQTNGGAGLELAYDLALAHVTPEGINAVILCTDGNFNVGLTSAEDLLRLVDRHAGTPVTLSVFGFGRGTRIDGRLEALAERGRGHSGYVNNQSEAERVLTEQVNGLLEPLAREVRAEVAFDPRYVAAYRRLGEAGTSGDPASPPPLAHQTILPGHRVTALYEVVWREDAPEPGEPLSPPWLTLALSYVPAAERAGRTDHFGLAGRNGRFAEASPGFKFSAVAAAFGEALQAGPEKAAVALAQVEAWGREVLPEDAGGYRQEFLDLVTDARAALPARAAAR